MKNQIHVILSVIWFVTAGHIAFSQPKPYLQTPTPTSIYISWHSTDTAFTQVRYGSTPSALTSLTQGSFLNNSGKIWHTVKLTGLTPATTYYYRCISGADSSLVFPFRTQPLSSAPGQHVRFVVVGDSRNNDTIPTYLPVVCENILQTLVAKYGTDWYNSVNLVMHTGDVVWSGKDINRFEPEYFIPISNLSCSVPFMVSIGNHEHESPHYFNYMKYTDFTDPEIQTTKFNQRFYSFRILNCEFLALNSNSGLVSESLQHAWLEKVLAISDTSKAVDLVFPFSHHPYRSAVWPEGDGDSVKIVFFSTFEKYSKVVQYSCGHAHCYEQGVWELTKLPANLQHDMRLLLSGGGGAELTRFGVHSKNFPEIIKAVDDYCYAIIDVDVDAKSYTAEAYTLGKPEHPIANQVFDTFHFRMNQPPPAQPSLFELNGWNPLVLNSSPISGADSCMSAEIQITLTPGDYTHPVLDTVRNIENIFENTGSPDFTPINRNAGINLYSFTVPAGKLDSNARHGFRLRYRDMNLKWSPWSQETLFFPNGIAGKPAVISGDLVLWQNHPNPFTSVTTLNYEVMSPQHIAITVTDLYGQTVCRPVDQDLNPGRYTLELPGTGRELSPGIYFLQLKGAHSTAIIRLVKAGSGL
ncbi:MAG: fibronectin type III domain-containing protein [Bacteroidota bacterium]